MLASDDSPLWSGLKAFSREFGKHAFDLATDEIPGIAQARAADKLINNRNLATGEEELGTLDRASSVFDCIPAGSLFKRAPKGFGSVGSLFAKRAASHAALRKTDDAAEAMFTPAVDKADDLIKTAGDARSFTAGRHAYPPPDRSACETTKALGWPATVSHSQQLGQWRQAAVPPAEVIAALNEAPRQTNNP